MLVFRNVTVVPMTSDKVLTGQNVIVENGRIISIGRQLAKLPDGAREVFVLHDIEGYKHEEIAELLGVTAGTSKSQLHRARMVLRDCLA